jgi:hypothetical protein
MAARYSTRVHVFYYSSQIGPGASYSFSNGSLSEARATSMVNALSPSHSSQTASVGQSHTNSPCHNSKHKACPALHTSCPRAWPLAVSSAGALPFLQIRNHAEASGAPLPEQGSYAWLPNRTTSPLFIAFGDCTRKCTEPQLHIGKHQKDRSWPTTKIIRLCETLRTADDVGAVGLHGVSRDAVCTGAVGWSIGKHCTEGCLAAACGADGLAGRAHCGDR